jgi:hypothetical protein
MSDYEDMDLDDLIAARVELIDELGEVEAAIADAVDEAECDDDDD